MTLRSGKEVEGPAVVIPKDKSEEKLEKEIEDDEKQGEAPKVNSDVFLPIKSNPPPFPSRLEQPKKPDKEKEILELFRKVEINIPLLDAIKQVPKYAKFLKDLCVNKRRLRDDEKVVVGENVSAVLQRKLPPKCGDPGMFIIPCKIGNTNVRRAMLDLGASINVMPRSIYAFLKLGPLKETRIIIQLADRTNAYPDGLLEDVLVQVNELIFPADFYVLDMDDERSPNPSPILLGRPFLSTARTKIDVHEGTLMMEFDGTVVRFNIFEAMKCPDQSNTVFSVSTIDPLVQEIFELSADDELAVALTKHLEPNSNLEVELNEDLKNVIGALQSLDSISPRFGFVSWNLARLDELLDLFPRSESMAGPRFIIILKSDECRIAIIQEDKNALERLNKSKEAALVEAEKILKSAMERALIVEEVQNQNFELKRQIEICQALSWTLAFEVIVEGKRTLERELARAKVSANRVASVVANEWKDDNDKVIPVKQWLEEKRIIIVDVVQQGKGITIGNVIATGNTVTVILSKTSVTTMAFKALGRLESFLQKFVLILPGFSVLVVYSENDALTSQNFHFNRNSDLQRKEYVSSEFHALSSNVEMLGLVILAFVLNNGAREVLKPKSQLDATAELEKTTLRSGATPAETELDMLLNTINEKETKTLGFEAATAEAELDMLLDSFGETKLLDSVQVQRDWMILIHGRLNEFFYKGVMLMTLEPQDKTGPFSRIHQSQMTQCIG
ncbi:hypothetical protein MRB53_015199 [Persea americana]|uniref:Uncharacterized protein n=1 Tax=Persea americana TaxID=3435 RepID=A0ACC2KD57_PERAE|nr:hypothetical protein MRB53_015199 [Persea americana]